MPKESFAKNSDAIVLNLYKEIFDYVISSCAKKITGSSKVLHIDARSIPEMDKKFDLVITSPPYPNRMSYIRELRPYMYWTKFLDDAREAGEMDWLAIGGTWGIATSRLNDWQPEHENLPELLYETVNRISKAKSKNGELLAKYVHKYFHDMQLHFESLRHVLSDNAELHYIVGNSTFFGIMVDTAEILAISMKNLGYGDVNYEIIRKRNCNKALFEYDVSAKWTKK
jgi:DNA modification methylase